MPSRLETGVIKRYQNNTIAEHLASNYVLGLLNEKVKRRVDSLRRDPNYAGIEQRISYWEQKLAPLNDDTPDLAPHAHTWDNIQRSLNIGEYQHASPKQNEKQSLWQRFSLLSLSGAFSIVVCAILLFSLIDRPQGLGEMSYVAVLEDSNNNPQVVAATYGDTQKLILDILELPEIDSQQSFELWVQSKTDNQIRSLGEIPKGQRQFDRELSLAEWRLIKDSLALVITVEDEGGSAIGEPSDMIVSRGLCIRLDNDLEQG